eukprot:m51a1_g1751 hypothetical protein (610) ;mRNA; f:222245-224323
MEDSESSEVLKLLANAARELLVSRRSSQPVDARSLMSATTLCLSLKQLNRDVHDRAERLRLASRDSREALERSRRRLAALAHSACALRRDLCAARHPTRTEDESSLCLMPRDVLARLAPQVAASEPRPGPDAAGVEAEYAWRKALLQQEIAERERLARQLEGAQAARAEAQRVCAERSETLRSLPVAVRRVAGEARAACERVGAHVCVATDQLAGPLGRLQEHLRALRAASSPGPCGIESVAGRAHSTQPQLDVVLDCGATVVFWPHSSGAVLAHVRCHAPGVALAHGDFALAGLVRGPAGEVRSRVHRQQQQQQHAGSRVRRVPAGAYALALPWAQWACGCEPMPAAALGGFASVPECLVRVAAALVSRAHANAQLQRAVEEVAASCVSPAPSAMCRTFLEAFCEVAAEQHPPHSPSPPPAAAATPSVSPARSPPPPSLSPPPRSATTQAEDGELLPPPAPRAQSASPAPVAASASHAAAPSVAVAKYFAQRPFGTARYFKASLHHGNCGVDAVVEVTQLYPQRPPQWRFERPLWAGPSWDTSARSLEAQINTTTGDAATLLGTQLKLALGFVELLVDTESHNSAQKDRVGRERLPVAFYYAPVQSLQ